MKCSECKYWVKSKVYGNHCSFRGWLKPCDAERRKKADKSRKKRHKKMDAYDKGSRKIRYNGGGEEGF